MRRLFFVPEPSAGGGRPAPRDWQIGVCPVARRGEAGRQLPVLRGYRGLSARTWMKGSPGAGGGRPRLVSLLRQWLPCGHQVG